MSSNNALDPELLAELVGDIDGLGIEVVYLRAAKASIRRAVSERGVPLDAICASVNQRLRALGRTVEPRHVQAILDEQEMEGDATESVFAASFRGQGATTSRALMSGQLQTANLPRHLRVAPCLNGVTPCFICIPICPGNARLMPCPTCFSARPARSASLKKMCRPSAC